MLFQYSFSGFFSFFLDNEHAINKYKTRIYKLFLLLILANLLYFVFDLFVNHSDIFSTIISMFSFDKCFNYLIFNISPTATHLWFIQALIYCYIIFFILGKLNIDYNKLYIWIPILLFVNIMLSEFSNWDILPMYYRNFLFTGLPFFSLGYLMHDKQEKITSLFSNNMLLGLIIPICLLTIFETFFLGKEELYVGSIMLACVLFIYCIKNPEKLNLKIPCWIGGNLYTSMYILHIMVIYSVVMIFSNNLGYFEPIVVFFITTIISTVIYEINKFL